MCAIKRHYAIARKSKAFQRFDEGKRPLDIDDVPITRRTLYQYYGEWRRERGIAGKRTGFALRKFNMRARIRAEERERRKREKETISTWVMDWEVILEALTKWDGVLEHSSLRGRLYLPGSNGHPWLRHKLLTNKDRSAGIRFLTREDNLHFYGKWAELGRKAKDIADFKRLCDEDGIGTPFGIVL